MYMVHGITSFLGQINLRFRSHHTKLPIKLEVLRQTCYQTYMREQIMSQYQLYQMTTFVFATLNSGHGLNLYVTEPSSLSGNGCVSIPQHPKFHCVINKTCMQNINTWTAH